MTAPEPGDAPARRVVVLVPFLTHIEPSCERCLRELEHRGVEVRRYPATAAIDRTRSEMATLALADGFDQLFWIDSDIVFDPADVERLSAQERAIVGGLYAKKGPQSFAAYFEPGTETITVGVNGGPMRVRYLGTGFLCTARRVYSDIQRLFSLPACNTRFSKPVVPYFLPMVIPDHGQPDGYWYLGEDYAFCERARKAGHEVIADTTVRLGHVGSYRYGWEDAVQSLQRVDGVVINLEADKPAL